MFECMYVCMYACVHWSVFDQNRQRTTSGKIDVRNNIYNIRTTSGREHGRVRLKNSTKWKRFYDIDIDNNSVILAVHAYRIDVRTSNACANATAAYKSKKYLSLAPTMMVKIVAFQVFALS